MAKKRKTGTRPQNDVADTVSDLQESRKRIRTYEDVADSDDEFHSNLDTIRLAEEPEAKRRRQWAERDEFLQPSDEEVLAYSDSDEDESDLDHEYSSAQPHSRLYGGSEDEDVIDTRESNGEEDDEEGLKWGTSKADLYGADAIETEEQALEEEAEALRIQKNQLKSMQAADYGFDESEWKSGETKTVEDDHDRDAIVTEVLPQLQIDPSLGPAEKLKFLKSRYPEFEFLSKDLLDLQIIHSELLEMADSSLSARIKLRTASAYIGALAMYFSLFTSPAFSGDGIVTVKSASQLRDHPVMDTLVKCRQLWKNVEKLSDNVTLDAGGNEEPANVNIHADHDVIAENEIPSTTPQLVERKSRAARNAEAVHIANENRKAQRLRQTEAGLADLDRLLKPGKREQVKSVNAKDKGDDDSSDLGEEAPLTAREAEEKAKRKKSLRFYTSQIAQKANKRGAAGRNAGGDDDIPHRERLRDRQSRLNAEAEKRGQRGADFGEALGGESDEEDRRQAQQIRADTDEHDYYDLVAARANKRKNDKAALADVQRQAALQNARVVQEEIVGADGKRKITYAIEKNKGLTPHRKKDVRNPRVKKKKKYEEKKKKLASMKPVYKGGEGRGGYGGELTGIKKGLVKSTKL